MTSRKYEIGGVSVEMTQEQADRWNGGESTERDLDDAVVSIPEPQLQSRQVSLRRATNADMEPEVAAMIDGNPANFIG